MGGSKLSRLGRIKISTKRFKYSIGVSSRVEQDRRSTHLNAQDELINWIIRKLDPDVVEDDEVDGGGGT